MLLAKSFKTHCRKKASGGAPNSVILLATLSFVRVSQGCLGEFL